MARLLLIAAASLCGCYKLDPFLYSPGRTDAYVFDPVGATPELSVSPERIHRHFIEVNGEIQLGAVELDANVVPPKGYVLFFHGKGGTLDNTWSEGRLTRLANLGYAVLAFDYRGWGMSTDVAPTEEGLDEDGAAVRGWWRSRLPPGSELIFYGNSFGTAPATQRAVSEPPAALVLEAPFSSLRDVQQHAAIVSLPLEFIAEASWDTAERISRVTAPVLLIHGTADEVLSVEFSKRLFEAANEPKELILVEGARHGDIAERMGAEYGRRLDGFLAPK